MRKYLDQPVEMNTNIGPHVLGTDAEHLVWLHSLGVGPLADHVVLDQSVIRIVCY